MCCIELTKSGLLYERVPYAILLWHTCGYDGITWQALSLCGSLHMGTAYSTELIASSRHLTCLFSDVLS